jgi:hypothetical protein
MRLGDKFVCSPGLNFVVPQAGEISGKMSGGFAEGTRLYRCSEGKWTWCGVLFADVRCKDRRRKAVVARHC